MASVYPGALDTFDPVPATLAGPVTHEELHEQLVNALAAVQSELGTDPAGAYATVKARLDAIVGFSGTRSTVAVPTGTFTDLVWSSESVDSDGYCSNSATITVPAGRGGLYSIAVRAVMASSVAYNLTPGIRILINGNTWDFPVFGAAAYFTATAVIPLAAADTVKVQVYQGSGGSINCNSAEIHLRRVGN